MILVTEYSAMDGKAEVTTREGMDGLDAQQRRHKLKIAQAQQYGRAGELAGLSPPIGIGYRPNWPKPT